MWTDEKTMGLTLEEVLVKGKYYKNDTEFDGNHKKEAIWSISGPKVEEDRVYTYDEAINLTGNGWYNISLLFTLALAIQGMAMDMFGFAYVVPAAACDLQLTHNQTSFLLSAPLMGAIISAYFHGYSSDTRGRKKCLSIVLWGSFLVASLSALSPNFTVLAILKICSSSMSSGVQSMAYTMLGETCSTRTKNSYMLALTCSFVCGYSIYTSYAYFLLGLDFHYDLGFITFKPWRLLVLMLAMTLGSSAVFINFFYESPKFLVNAERTAEALEILRKIKKANRGGDHYPVKKIILLEANSNQRRDVSFVRSLWEQTAPLFAPPLLQWTLLLFYMSLIVYSVNNGFFLWIPVLTRSFFKEPSTLAHHVTNNFCNLLNSTRSGAENNDCTLVVTWETLLMSVVQGLTFLIINCVVILMTHKKKTMTICIFVFSSLSCLAMIFITEKFTTIVFFFGVQTNCFNMGIIFCYFIEMYPTRYRGMITSLGVMVARASGITGVNLVGAYTFTHCTTSLYILAVYVFSGALVALLLPPDLPKKP